MAYSAKLTEICVYFGDADCTNLLSLTVSVGRNSSAAAAVDSYGNVLCVVNKTGDGHAIILNGMGNGCQQTHWVQSSVPSLFIKYTKMDYTTVSGYYPMGGHATFIDISAPVSYAPDELAYYFAYPFSVVFFFFLLGHLIGIIKKTVNKL